MIGWKEVPIEDYSGEGITAEGLRSPFNLRETITGEYQGERYNTFVFRGVVIDRKQYEVTWVDDDGEQWGPFPRAIFTVKVTEEYYGRSPVSGDTIKVLYTIPLADSSISPIRIMDNAEYVFVNCWVLDDQYAANDAKLNPQHGNDVSVENADVILHASWSSLLPVVDGKVILYNGFVSHNKSVMDRALSSDSVNTDVLASSDYLTTGDMVVLDEAVFEEAFASLFSNPQALPSENQAEPPLVER